MDISAHDFKDTLKIREVNRRIRKAKNNNLMNAVEVIKEHFVLLNNLLNRLFHFVPQYFKELHSYVIFTLILLRVTKIDILIKVLLHYFFCSKSMSNNKRPTPTYNSMHVSNILLIYAIHIF